MSTSEQALPEVLIVIPAMNEEQTIGKVIRDIELHTGFDVVVIDDCSSDNTAEEARSNGATVLRLVSNLGAWGATQTGIRYARDRQYSRVVTMDADGQHFASEILPLLHGLDNGTADVVIGACTRRGSSARKLTWKVLRAITGMPVNDLTSGFRAYNQKAILSLASPLATLIDWQDVGVLFMLHYAGLRVKETVVDMAPRACGHSRIFKTWFAVLDYLVFSGIISVSKTMHSTKVSKYFR